MAKASQDTAEQNQIKSMVPPTSPTALGNQPQGPAVNRKSSQQLLSRLKNSGLDPQKLLDVTLASSSRKTAKQMRRRAVILTFIGFVLLPAFVVAVYMFAFASDQYHSTTAFAVRNSQSVGATEILGMVLNTGADSTTSNSYILNDYLQSQTIVEDVSKTTDLDQIFNREGADWYFRMGEEIPIENRIDYWNSMVDVEFDSTSGVIFVEVRAFSPDDALNLSSIILERSERLVNKLSEDNRRETVRFAEETVARAEARLKVIRQQMVTYREETQEVSPEENARIAIEMIGELDQQLAAKDTERSTLLTYLDKDSPRIRILTEQINSLQRQIENKRKRLGGGGAEQDAANDPTSAGNRSISYRISDYSALALEQEFAEQFYTTALAGLEQARRDAASKHTYLATFIPPTLSEDAQYPDRFIYVLSAFLLVFGLWVVGVLTFYNLRDRT